jgi:hypothetical protein
MQALLFPSLLCPLLLTSAQLFNADIGGGGVIVVAAGGRARVARPVSVGGQIIREPSMTGGSVLLTGPEVRRLQRQALRNERRVENALNTGGAIVPLGRVVGPNGIRI